MRRQQFLELSPIEGSNFERDYSFVDYRGKVVLDIGADYGTTAAYFLRRGAVRVVAVEGDEQYFSLLQENAEEVPEVTPVNCRISSPKQLEDLITTYQPDILKADCEGCELHLLNVPDRILRKVPEYLLEVHNTELWERFRRKFQALGYTITHVDLWTTQLFEFATGIGEVRIVHAMPTQLLFNKRIKEMEVC